MKEMAMLTDKMGGGRETEDHHMNPTHVMDLMHGFEDKRLLKESQAYIKEFRNGDHQPDRLSSVEVRGLQQVLIFPNCTRPLILVTLIRVDSQCCCFPG